MLFKNINSAPWQCCRWAGYIIFSHLQQWQLTVRDRVSAPMGSIQARGPLCFAHASPSIATSLLSCLRWIRPGIHTLFSHEPQNRRKFNRPSLRYFNNKRHYSRDTVKVTTNVVTANNIVNICCIVFCKKNQRLLSAIYTRQRSQQLVLTPIIYDEIIDSHNNNNS